MFSFLSSSDYDSDVLLAAESEAMRSPLTYQQVLLFDKSVVQRAKRRYISEHFEVDSDDSINNLQVVRLFPRSQDFFHKVFMRINILGRRRRI